MELTITERDKKLLYFLAIFVLIVGVGFGVAGPLANAGLAASETLQSEELVKMEMEQKILALDNMNTSLEKVEGDLKAAEGSFYPLMDSAAIDKMITEELMRKGIVIRDLDITMPARSEYTTLTDYGVYLNSFLGQTFTEKDPAQAQKPEAITYGGIYTAKVGLLLSGDRNVLQSALDEFAKGEPKLRIADFTWSAEKEGMEADQLAVTLELYMVQDTDSYVDWYLQSLAALQAQQQAQEQQHSSAGSGNAQAQEAADMVK